MAAASESNGDGCPLCNLERRTYWYYEDKIIVICDCETCKVPMVVLRRHTLTPTRKEMEHLIRVVGNEFGVYSFRTRCSTVHDHFHYHIVTDV